MLPATTFAAIFYAMMGLKKATLPFFRYLLAAALASIDSALLCSFIYACSPQRPGAASLVATVLLLVCLLVNGYNLNLTALPDWCKWLPDVSFAKHSFEIMLAGELDGTDVMVDIVPGVPPVEVRAEVILNAMGLSVNRYETSIAALFAIAIVHVLCTIIVVALQLSPPTRFIRRLTAAFTFGAEAKNRRETIIHRPENAITPDEPSWNQRAPPGRGGLRRASTTTFGSLRLMIRDNARDKSTPASCVYDQCSSDSTAVRNLSAFRRGSAPPLGGDRLRTNSDNL